MVCMSAQNAPGSASRKPRALPCRAAAVIACDTNAMRCCSYDAHGPRLVTCKFAISFFAFPSTQRPGSASYEPQSSARSEHRREHRTKPRALLIGWPKSRPTEWTQRRLRPNYSYWLGHPVTLPHLLQNSVSNGTGWIFQTPEITIVATLPLA